ncbi:MAG: glycosyltransferase [Anaerolineae bacterium]|nr:glycosyltransferase [Anaerolineae bacterium]
MNSNIRLSVVTPSYQQALFLEQTMLSVLNQDVEGLEYIVVDGGSTDGSVDIIRRHADRLAWWISEEDEGQADAINKGLRQTRGEIVAWLNSDDVYQPGTLKKVLDYFDRHPDIGLVYGDVLAIDGANQAINLMRYEDWGLDGLMRFEIIGQPGVFFRRKFLQETGLLDTRFHYTLDHHLWLRIAARTSIAYLPETLAAARYHAGAKNVAQAASFGADAFRILEWMQTDALFEARYRRNEKRILSGAYRFNAYYMSEGERWGEALRDYLRSFWNYPANFRRDWPRFVYTLLNTLGLYPLVSLAVKMRKQRRDKTLAGNG